MNNYTHSSTVDGEFQRNAMQSLLFAAARCVAWLCCGWLAQQRNATPRSHGQRSHATPRAAYV